MIESFESQRYNLTPPTSSAFHRMPVHFNDPLEKTDNCEYCHSLIRFVQDSFKRFAMYSNKGGIILYSRVWTQSVES